MSITEAMNTLTLLSGRMPQAGNECVVDGYQYGEDMIGKEISIGANNSQEIKDSFAYDTYTVVGLIRSPLYMNMERGTTTIGNGRIDSFLFLPLSGFDYEYYKEVYVTASTQEPAFTEAYHDHIEAYTQELEDQVIPVLSDRYERELADAREKLADARAELTDGEQELADAKRELTDGEQELADARTELDEKTADARAELADAKKELTDGEQELADAQKDLEEGSSELMKQEQELVRSEAELSKGEREYQEAVAEYEEGQRQYEAGYAQYQAGLSEYEKNLADYQAYVTMLGENAPAFQEQLAAMEAALAQARAELDAARQQLDRKSVV